MVTLSIMEEIATPKEVQAYYAQGRERTRLTLTGAGRLEFERRWTCCADTFQQRAGSSILAEGRAFKRSGWRMLAMKSSF